MISICGTVLNAKHDFQMMVEALHKHNKGTDFEICVTHDDRVDDGSHEEFKVLEKEYSRLKIFRRTHEDSVEYLKALMNYYSHKGLFKDILPQLRSNLLKYERQELFDHKSELLWLTPGVGYNNSVENSSGEVILVGSTDFAYMFKLRDLEEFILKNKRNGLFYGKLHAIWAAMTNQDVSWVRDAMNEINKGGSSGTDYRWDNQEMYLKTYCIESITKGGVKHIVNFHGSHAMTRKTYDAIGGFTEEFYGRALAEDKMTTLGRKFSQRSLPPQFSFAWTTTGELHPNKGQGYPKDWEETLKAKDPFYETRPIPPIYKPTYLHKDIISNKEAADRSATSFDQSSPTVRILKNGAT